MIGQNDILSVIQNGVSAVNNLTTVLKSAAASSGVIPVSSGGTGSSTFTTNDLIYYNGTKFLSLTGASWSDGVGQLALTGTETLTTSSNSTQNPITTFHPSCAGFLDSAYARNVFTDNFATSHSTSALHIVHISGLPTGGGGGAGEFNGDIGLGISLWKKDITGSTVTGELDGIEVVVRNGGPDTGGSDASGLLLNSENIGTVGSITCWEGRVSHVTRALVDDLDFNVQGGVILTTPGSSTLLSYGFVVAPSTISLVHINYGYYVGPDPSATPAVSFPFFYNGGTLTNQFGVDLNSNVQTTGSIGYSDFGGGGGVGGSVTQPAGSKTNPVTINKICGQIITDGAAMVANTTATFFVNNTKVVATDTIILNISDNGTGSPGNYAVAVTGVVANGFDVTILCLNNGSNVLTLNFAVVKAVNS